jgi:hypothetical protein
MPNVLDIKKDESCKLMVNKINSLSTNLINTLLSFKSPGGNSNFPIQIKLDNKTSEFNKLKVNYNKLMNHQNESIMPMYKQLEKDLIFKTSELDDIL